MNLVSLRDVSVVYDGYEALRNVSLGIEHDDFLGVIGPNGGGKTTLIKAVLVKLANRGEIRIAQARVSRGQRWSED